MHWLLLGLGLLIATALLLQAFAAADPKKLARTVRWGGVVLAGVLGLALVVSGRAGMLFWLLPLLLPFLARMRVAQHRAKAAAGPAPGQTSAVETAHLRMWLDHDSGGMDGEVLTGRHAGRQLSGLSESELLDLVEEMRTADPQSQSLLEAFLDRQFPDWRQAAGQGAGAEEGGEAHAGGGRATSSGGGMTLDQAWEVLGLEPGASAEEIKEAHRRLMLRNHPDQGGSTFIAAQINQAKDLLLRRHKV